MVLFEAVHHRLFLIYFLELRALNFIAILRPHRLADFGLDVGSVATQVLAKITPSSRLCERGATTEKIRPHRLAWSGRMVLSH